VIGEIQTIFDQQSKKAVLAECKNEIPTKGIPTIMDEYFPELNKMLKEFDNWLALLETTDDSYQEEIAREDDYDQPQSLFPSLLEGIPQDCVQEVMSYFVNARFHIILIPKRWYNNSKINEDEASVPIYQIKKIESNELPQPLSFQHLARFKQTPNVIQLHGPKQKYGFGMGYAKKALDLAICANKNSLLKKTKRDMSVQDENVNLTNVDVSVGDPLRVQHKGEGIAKSARKLAIMLHDAQI
ncbi:12993_t:CDS:2, partial [Racocetra fulgida]